MDDISLHVFYVCLSTYIN